MYVYYNRKPENRKILEFLGPKFAPVIFMFFHISFFIVSSVFAMLSYGSFYINTFFMMLWITLSIWNGANFYMEYFSRKYESSLKKLEELEN